jgi:hypothetical protein
MGLTVSFGTAARFAAVMLVHALTAPGPVLVHGASNLMKRVLWATFLLLQLAACSGNSKPEDLPYRAVRLDPSWIPIYWTADDVVLFKNDESLFTYDVSAQTEGTRVRSGPVSVNCVDFDRGEVHFARVQAAGGSTSYTYGFYLDLKTMKIEELPDDQSIWRGSYNCPRFLDYRAKERRLRHERLRVSYLGESWQTPSEYHYAFQNLIRDSEGFLVILEAAGTANDERRFLYFKRNDEVRFEPVEKVLSLAAYDPSTGMYLIYQETRDFEKHRGSWPLTSRLLTLESRSFQEIPIPEGPWIVTYGFIDQLKGFSCGISCYTNMRLFLVGNRILISVWGRLVSARTRGLYELRGERWVKLRGYAGEDPPAIVNATDGCRLVIHHPKETLLMDLCRGPVSTRDHLSRARLSPA